MCHAYAWWNESEEVVSLSLLCSRPDMMRPVMNKNNLLESSYRLRTETSIASKSQPMCAAVVPFALGNLVLASLDFVDPGFLELDQGRKNITWWSTSSFVLHASLFCYLVSCKDRLLDACCCHTSFSALAIKVHAERMSSTDRNGLLMFLCRPLKDPRHGSADQQAA